MTKATYWNHNGTYSAHIDALEALIPMMGEIPNAKQNPALERFRKASNCYYDLYNNGLGNRAREFARLFFRTSDYKIGFCEYTDRMYERAEEVMDVFVRAALIEQKILPAS